MEYTERTHKLLDGGLSVEQVEGYCKRQKDQLIQGGLSTKDANAFIARRFGVNLGGPEILQDPTWKEAFIAGYQRSVTGLKQRGKMSSVELAPEASLDDKVLQALGQTVGDLPYSVAGFIIGGGTGVAGGPAAPATVPMAAFGGAVALPEAMRHLYMHHITEGNISKPGQFWELLKSTTAVTLKAEAIGMAAGGATRLMGPLAESAAQKLVSPLAALSEKASGTLASGAASMATDSAAVAAGTVTSALLEGRMPTKDDLVVGMATIAATKTAAAPARYMTGKAVEAYKRSGFNIFQYAKEMPLSMDDVTYVRSKNQLYPRGFEDQVKGMQQAKAAFKADEQAVAVTPAFYQPQNMVDKAWSSFWDLALKPFKGKGYREMFDGLIKLQQASDDPAVQRLYQDARKIPNSSRKAQRMLFDGLYDLQTGAKIGPSLKQTLSKITDRAGFEKFLRAFQSREVVQTGNRPTMENAKAFEGLVKGSENPHFQEALNNILKFREQLIYEGTRAGYFSQKTAKTLLDNNKTLLPISHELGKAKPNWKKLTQADQLHNPAETLIQDTYRLYRQYEINSVKARAFDLLGRRPTAKKPVGRDEVEVDLAYDAKGKVVGGTIKELDAQGKATYSTLGDEAIMETDLMSFRHAGRYVKVAMPKEIVQALKSLDPKEMNPIVKLLKIPASATRLGTVLDPAFWTRMTGVDLALAPIFSKNNFRPVVDHLVGAGTLFGSWLYRRNPKLFGMLSDADAVYNDAISNGAFGASYVHADMSPATLRTVYSHNVQNVVNLVKSKDRADLLAAINPWNNAKYFAGRSVNALGSVTESLDAVARIGEFRRAKAAGKGSPAAAFDAREINLDFTRTGTATTALNALIAFFNPALQSAAKIASMAKNQPTTLLTRGMAGIAYPSFLLAMAEQDILHNSPDSDAARNIRALSQVDRDFYWRFWSADGECYRVRTPFEIGAAFKLPAEALAKFLYDKSGDTNLLAQMWQDDQFKAIGETFVPPMVPNFVTPVLEPLVNYSLFRDRPIVPGWAQRLVPQLQSDAATTQIAKEMSQALNGFSPIATSTFWERYTSPQAIDHLMTSWTGGAGKLAVTLADQMAQTMGIVDKDFVDWSNPCNIPILKTFYLRNPQASAIPLVRARERLINQQTKINSIRHLYKMGEQYSAIHKTLLGLHGDTVTQSQIEDAQRKLWNPNKAINKLGDLGSFIRVLTNRTKYKTEELDQLFTGIMNLTKSSRVQQVIWESKGQFTPKLKDALVEELRWQQIGMAERINEMLDRLEKKGAK